MTTFSHQLNDGRTLRLTTYGPSIMRVQVGSPARPRASLSVSAQPSNDGRVQEPQTLRTAAFSARITDSGHLKFFKNDRPFLIETARQFPQNTYPNEEDRFGAEQVWTLPSSDALYGLGQFQDGVMNRRNSACTLIHGNVTVVVPFFVSTAGWGILWDNASHTEFSDSNDGLRMWSEVADGIDYYVCVGSNAHAVIAGYRHLTGQAPLFPRGFYGFIQCKERYTSAAELVAVSEEHRDRKLPLDVIVQDWRYWGETTHWSSMVYDPESYGDLPAAINRIHDLHISVMISIWPVIGADAALHQELQAAGHLFPTVHWSTGLIYDAFSDEARQIYWRHAKEGLFHHGVDAWWMDGTEPEFVDCHDHDAHKASLIAERDTAAGSWARVLNAFSLVTTKGVYEGQRATTDQKRVFILTRSAFAGQQAYAAATWSGDISANWDTLKKQVPAGLNFCASGIPYWTTDNGAFFVRGRGGTFPQGVHDPAFKEFFLRWTQYSVFCPLMRSHGTQTPREIWQFGEPGDIIYDSLVASSSLRMQLLPYTYSLAYETWKNGYTPMHPIGFQFPDDKQSHEVSDQFFYGPSLMACPVLEPKVHPPTERCDVLTAWGQCRVGNEDGIEMRVYDGFEADQPTVVTQSLDDFDHSWSGNAPPGVTSEQYRVEFICDLVTDAPAKRRQDRILLVQVAGRVRIALAGHRVIDEWQDYPLREHKLHIPGQESARIPLSIEYGHEKGEAMIRVGWDMSEQIQEIIHPAQERPVYLPPGDWFDFQTNAKHPGGQTIISPAPLSHIPVFVPAGSIIPFGAVKQWHDETPDESLEIRIYTGKDAEFRLYEDAGNSYAYEQGVASTIHISWHQATETCTIHDRQGAFPGMLTARRFTIVLIKNATEFRSAIIDYQGQRQTYSFHP